MILLLRCSLVEIVRRQVHRERLRFLDVWRPARQRRGARAHPARC
jgi:hypothetical protein